MSSIFHGSLAARGGLERHRVRLALARDRDLRERAVLDADTWALP